MPGACAFMSRSFIIYVLNNTSGINSMQSVVFSSMQNLLAITILDRTVHECETPSYVPPKQISNLAGIRGSPQREHLKYVGPSEDLACFSGNTL